MFGRDSGQQPFDVNFTFAVSPDRKTLVPVGLPYVVGNDEIELFGSDIIREYLKKLKNGREIVSIDPDDEGGLNVTYK